MAWFLAFMDAAVEKPGTDSRVTDVPASYPFVAPWLSHLRGGRYVFRVCSDANATAGVVRGLGVDGISKRPNTAIT